MNPTTLLLSIRNFKTSGVVVTFCLLFSDGTDKVSLWILLSETTCNVGLTVSCDSEFSNRIIFHFKPVTSFGDPVFFYCEE